MFTRDARVADGSVWVEYVLCGLLLGGCEMLGGAARVVQVWDFYAVAMLATCCESDTRGSSYIAVKYRGLGYEVGAKLQGHLCEMCGVFKTRWHGAHPEGVPRFMLAAV